MSFQLRTDHYVQFTLMQPTIRMKGAIEKKKERKKKRSGDEFRRGSAASCCDRSVGPELLIGVFVSPKGYK